MRRPNSNKEERNMNTPWTTLTVIAVIVTLLLLFKLYLMLTTGWNRSPTCLIGKTAIVTGANTGIGFHTALDFAKRGAKVILACRDRIRAETAKTKIIETTGNPNIVVKILDLSSLASIRKFAVEITTTEERLDILVNNAGLYIADDALTSDGLNLIMQVNYFGPFLLTILLTGLLKQSAPSRIVNVSSMLAGYAKIDKNDLNAIPGTCFSTLIRYNNSKLCLILFTNELARKLKGSGVDVNSLHPGVIQSDLFRNMSSISKRMINGIGKWFTKTVEEGAQTQIYLSVSKDIDGVSGEYFMDCKINQMEVAQDKELATEIWEKSVKFVKLTTEEQQAVMEKKNVTFVRLTTREQESI